MDIRCPNCSDIQFEPDPRQPSGYAPVGAGVLRFSADTGQMKMTCSRCRHFWETHIDEIKSMAERHDPHYADDVKAFGQARAEQMRQQRTEFLSSMMKDAGKGLDENAARRDADTVEIPDGKLQGPTGNRGNCGGPSGPAEKKTRVITTGPVTVKSAIVVGPYAYSETIGEYSYTVTFATLAEMQEWIDQHPEGPK